MFALGTFVRSDGDQFPGLVLGDHVHDLRAQFGATATTGEMIESWDMTLARLRQIAHAPPRESLTLDALRPLAPVQPVGQVFCAGANYRKHLSEMLMATANATVGEALSNSERRDAAQVAVQERAESGEPFIFAMPSSSVSGARDDVVLWGPGVQHDWELELALVIGRRARNVRPEAAMTCVAGYTMSNDISTRDVMSRPNLSLTDFLMTKGRPGFFPTGPFLVPREFVDDYRQLHISLKVNGQVMQDEHVDDIIYGVEDLVSYASTITELRPGDLLLTGSPGGNAGHHGNRWLRAGDLLEGEITGLGIMRNRCVAEPSDNGHG